MSLGVLLDSLVGLRPLVIGDLMLDEYIFGRATRISPEAPVMVVRQKATKAVPGGAANVAANMVALGALPSVIGVVGDDEPGSALCSALTAAKIDAQHVIVDKSRPTTRKTRILANHNQQVLRIDHEETEPISAAIATQLLESVQRLLPEIDVILISDYQKGAVTGEVIKSILKLASTAGKPVVANPKPKSVPDYSGATLVSLNRFEASEAFGYSQALEDSDAPIVAKALQAKFAIENMVVTLGGSGMVCAGTTAMAVPAVQVELYDEAGAGDTVIATLALAVGAQKFGLEALSLAAATAAAVVQKVGVAVPTAEDLALIRK